MGIEHWTEGQDAVLRAMWAAGKTWAEIGVALNRNRGACACRRMRLGLPPRHGEDGRRRGTAAIRRNRNMLREQCSRVAGLPPLQEAEAQRLVDAAIAAGRVTVCPPAYAVVVGARW
jgi:hypothetical protein